jgi:hypothetical protein
MFEKEKSNGDLEVKSKQVYSKRTIKALDFEVKGILLFVMFSFFGFVALLVSWLMS